jgi:hypothetical protein
MITPSKISIVFYTTPHSKRARLVQMCQFNEIYHCGILIEQGDSAFILAADKTHRAKFVPEELYHQKMFNDPDKVIVLGESDINLKHTCDFVTTNYRGDTLSMAFWFFIGRHLFKSYVPKSCSILSCQLARICGFKIDDYVLPKDLYKHLLTKKYTKEYSWEEYKENSDANDFNSRTGGCR